MTVYISGTTGVDKVQDGSIGTDDLANASITAAKLSGAQTGSAPIYGCRAWCNYKGTASVVVNGSGNISSVTVNGTGDYTFNFAVALPSANYAVAIGYAPILGGTAAAARNIYVHTQAAGSLRVQTRDSSGTLADFESISISIFC